MRSAVRLLHGRQEVVFSSPAAESVFGEEAGISGAAGAALGPGQLVELPFHAWRPSEALYSLRSGDGQPLVFELWFRGDQLAGAAAPEPAGATVAEGMPLLRIEVGSDRRDGAVTLSWPGAYLLLVDNRDAWFRTATAHFQLTLTPLTPVCIYIYIVFAPPR